MFEYKHDYFQSEYGGIWGGTVLARECWRVKTTVCYCVCMCVFVGGVKARDSVHSASRGSVMQAAPFLPKHFDVLFIRGGKASGVFNSTTTATAAEISACFFFPSSAALTSKGGTFVLEITHWKKMSVLWFISLNKPQIARQQLLRRYLDYRTNKGEWKKRREKEHRPRWHSK